MDFKQIKKSDAQNYFNLFNRQDICFTHGNGNKLYDTHNNEYVDFFGGIAVNLLGHNHPAITNAICEQAKKLIHISNIFYIDRQAELSSKLLEGTVFEKVAFFNSGAEANETAIKLVRKHYYNQGKTKHKIVTALNSFHGRTLATLTATGQEKYAKPYAPLPEGFIHVPFNDFDALKKLVDNDEQIGAIMLECIQGESGVRPANCDYMLNVYTLCKTKDILLIIDEVQTGMGRTGKMFGFENYGIEPDIITLAKGLGGGIPIGACLSRGEVANAFYPGDHGSTFGGNPLSCAVGCAVVDTIKKDNLLKKVNELGTYLSNKLATLKKHNFVKDIRGLGLLLALELDEKLPNIEVVLQMLKKGFVLNSCGSNCIRFAPPFTITTKEIDAMVTALADIFAKTNI